MSGWPCFTVGSGSGFGSGLGSGLVSAFWAGSSQPYSGPLPLPCRYRSLATAGEPEDLVTALEAVDDVAAVRAHEDIVAGSADDGGLLAAAHALAVWMTLRDIGMSVARDCPSSIGVPMARAGRTALPRLPRRGSPLGVLCSVLMRTALEALERSGVAWFMTGSEALAAYGSPRQTMDVDVVVEAFGDQLHDLPRSMQETHYFSEPIRVGNRSMAALIDLSGAGKVDLIVRDADAWGHSAMERRQRWVHPTLGRIWVSSLEDLILVKLERSEGSSELQLRDCAALLRIAAGSEDAAYLDEWAGRLGVASILQQVREAADAT